MENVIARNNMENFILGGNCTFTLSSKRTNNHYVYNIRANKEKTIYFVTVKDYNADVYAGYIVLIFIKNITKMLNILINTVFTY